MKLTRGLNVRCWYADHLIEFKESPQKGLGVFAKTNIPRGTRIITETALLGVNTETVMNIVPAFERLPPSQQECYLELHEYAGDLFKSIVELETGKSWQDLPELHRKVLAIYAANTFGSVFYFGSRLNHSCIPNVNFAYHPFLRQETFHVIRDIVAGEELTIMYIDGTMRTRSQRQQELSRWGFQCTCPACEDTVQGRQKEEKRVALFALSEELAANAANRTDEAYRTRLLIRERMVAIQKSEGLVNRELRFGYYEAAKCCLKLNEQKMLLSWTEKMLEVDRYCIGEDHPEYRQLRLIADCMRKAIDDSQPIHESAMGYFEEGPAEECAIM